MIAHSPTSSPPLLYIAARLPSRSETFVYREVFGLRSRGRMVYVASVHPPERDLGNAMLDRLADESVPIYGDGIGCLLRDALKEAAAHPVRAVRTLLRCVHDVLRATDVPLKRTPRILFQGIASLALARRVRPLGIMRIHAHMAHVPATIAMYAAQQLGASFSFTGHAVDLFRDRALLDVKLRRATFVSCISRWHQEFYRGMMNGCQSPPLPLVRCGVNVREFRPRRRKENRQLSAAMSQAGPFGTSRWARGSGSGASAKTLNLLAVGRLVPKKGFDLLLNALAEMRTYRPWRCMIVGDGPERDRLSRLIEQLELRSHVELAGARPNGDVRALMQRADVFVLPCRVDSSGDRDGIPVVLMEAMASGLACICGDLPTIRELIADKRSGLLVDPDRDGELSHALSTLLGDQGLRERLARCGRRRVQAEFSLDVNLARLEGAFDAKRTSPQVPACQSLTGRHKFTGTPEATADERR